MLGDNPEDLISPEPTLKWKFADNPICNFVLAHGGSEGWDSEFMSYFAYKLAELGINVARI